MPNADVNLTPRALLAVSDHLLRTEVPGTLGVWPRATAFLVRMALERAVAEFWSGTAPGVESTSMRAQLLCLREYVDLSIAGRADSAWAALSSACHYHGYDLAPTSTELRAWHTDVTNVCDSISGPRLTSTVEEEPGGLDVSGPDVLAHRRYRYSHDRGGWIDTQVAATGREPRVWTEDQARGRERVHQEARLRVLARMGSAESEDERRPMRREWAIRRAIIRAADAGDPLPRP